MKKWIPLALAFVWMLVLFSSSPLWRQDTSLLFPCLCVAILAIYPSVAWIREGMNCVPTVEIFCLLHIVFYLVPTLEQREDTLAYSFDIRWMSIWCVAVFLTCINLSAAYQKSRGHLNGFPFAWTYRRFMPSHAESYLCWLLLCAWLGFKLIVYFRFLPDLGTVYRPVSAAATAFGAISSFHFANAWGKNSLTLYNKIMFSIIAFLSLAFEFVSGFLTGGTGILILLAMSYAMGSRKVPVVFCGLCFLLVAFLHVGKGEMRARFWDSGGGLSTKVHSPLSIYSYWTQASWNAILDKSEKSGAANRLLARGSLMHTLNLTVRQSPERQDFIYGKTYYQTILLCIPRIVWPGKPRGTLPSETLAIYYGLQTKQSVEHTSVAMGQVAEGWANFGWFGIVGAGLAMGTILSLPRRLSLGAEGDSARLLMAVVALPAGIDLEHCFGQWFTILLNSTCASSVFLYFLCRQSKSSFSSTTVNRTPRPLFPTSIVPRRGAPFVPSQGHSIEQYSDHQKIEKREQIWRP